MWEVLSILKGAEIRRIHLVAWGRYTLPPDRLKSDFTLAVDVVDGETLQGRLRDAQMFYQSVLARRSRAPHLPVAPAAAPARRRGWAGRLRAWWRRLG
jgi:hypothetical protein